RDHAFPARARTQVVMTARAVRPHPAKYAEEGVKAVAVRDIRWGRCDIKSVSLLPNVLAKQQAKESGAYEALLVDRDGMLIEGSSTNVWMVSGDGKLVTCPANGAILNGITRLTVIDIARREGLDLVERPFSLAEALAAREVFITSTSSYVMPVTQIDDRVIANGRPGSLSIRLRTHYFAHMAAAGRRP
ncbi:MAG: aminotransferase class IV, partial [Rhodospirillales bacterium]|nr:aminotransferase class IV [Rhodospirillales bacterium]